MGAAPSLTLLRPARVHVGPAPVHKVKTPAAAGKHHFGTLAALLKATPATALLQAQRQRLVVVKTTDSLTGAFARLIDADVLSAPVFDAAAERYIGWLDLRDLSGLILVRYTYGREQRAARNTKAAGAAAHAEEPVAPPPTPISCAEFIADTVKGSTEAAADKAGSASDAKAAGAAGAAAVAPAASAASAAAKATAKAVDISIESLASRYPWRPLPSTASLFDVAKELVQDVRRVPIVDVATEQVLGVITQSSVIQYLASRMAVPLPGAGHHSVHVPLHANAKANALSNQPTPTLAAVAAAKAAQPPAADAKEQAAAATHAAAQQTGGSAAIGAAGAVKLAAAAAVAGEAAAAAAAPASLDGLGLKDNAHSDWHKPLSALVLSAGANAGDTAAPTIALGSAPVWSVADTTPLADALWQMHEANTSTLAVTDSRTGGLSATLTTNDLKLYLRNKRWGDALLEKDVRTFLAAVRAGDQALAGAAVLKAGAHSSAHVLETAAPAVIVSADASLAAVVQRMAACHARKVFVCGAHPPYVPLRVITLTDVLVYVVSSEAAAVAAAAAKSAAAADAAMANTAANPKEAEAGVALGSAIAAGPICPLPA